ncbi:autotransporter domain-containing esterase, partial [Pseudomonas aeruginosa]
SQLSGTFNAELTAQLSQAGANDIPLNIPLLLKEGKANPASFGLAADQNLIGTSFSGNGCTMNPTYGIIGSTPDPSKLLFND